MHKKIFLIALFFALAFATTTKAHVDSASGMTPKHRAEHARDDRKASSTNDMKKATSTMIDRCSDLGGDRRATSTRKIKCVLSEVQKKNVLKHFGNVSSRYEQFVARLEKISDKLEARIKKFEEKGSNMTEPKRLLGVADGKITIAKQEVQKLKTLGQTVPDAATPRDKFEAYRMQMNKAKEAIKAAHKALVDVVRNMKPGANKQRNATTTPPGTPTNTGTSTATSTATGAGN